VARCAAGRWRRLMLPHEIYEFGDFVLDSLERRLARRGERVHLEPKTHDLLVTLVRRAGQLITKRELLDLVWADAFVEEGILAVHISTLRKALGDREGDHPHIETVSRSGYRFIAPVSRRMVNDRRSTDRWSLAAVPTSRPEVYELIGRGRTHLLTASMREVPKAVAAFRSAIELDPTYAAAHAGLALACCAQAELRVVPQGEAYDEARAAALRALAMDASSADAQVALGTVLFLSEWNWEAARRTLERALELNPDHTEARLLYGRLLEALGDFDGGLASKHQALERDPFSARVTLEIALSCWNQRRYDEVIAWANRALELDPEHLLARECISAAYLMKGDHDRHMAENIRHAESFGAPSETIAELKNAYANGGRLGVIRHVLASIARGAKFPPFQLALLHGEAGDLESAFRHLNEAIDGHDPALVHLAVGPQWDCLRGDPRFSQCLARMGLVPGT